MSEKRPPESVTESTRQRMAPVGKLGFRGRSATPQEREQVLDAFFFEGGRRIPYLQQYFVLMLLSATIAGLGLANDSAAVVIGAMLVAPLMTPILAIAAALVQGWGRRMLDSLAIVGAGALVAIGVGVAIAFASPHLRTGLPLPGELLARTNPNLLDLGIALAAGAAAGFVAVRTEASGALPGVGIAVALVPPLATAGITAGLGEWGHAFGALLLFLTNLVAIVLAAGLVFAGAGFAAYRDELGGRQTRLAVLAVVAGTIVVGIPLSAHSIQRVSEGNAIVSVAESVAEWAPDLSLEEVTIDRSQDPVAITIAVTGIEAPPGAGSLADRLVHDLDRAVDVSVIYVPVELGSAPAP